MTRPKMPRNRNVYNIQVNTKPKMLILFYKTNNNILTKQFRF